MLRRREERLAPVAGALSEPSADGVSSDVPGSDTGRAADGSRPTQDADDL